MAIAPLDIQTLYSQLDKVSKNVVQQQVSQIKGVLDNEQNAQKLAEQRKTVEQLPSKEEGMGEIKNNLQNSHNNQQKYYQQKNEEVVDETEPEVIKDPSLGKKFDSSG